MRDDLLTVDYGQNKRKNRFSQLKQRTLFSIKQKDSTKVTTARFIPAEIRTLTLLLTIMIKV